MKRFCSFLAILLTLSMVVPAAHAEENFPPQGDGKGYIGGRNGESWRYVNTDAITSDGTNLQAVPAGAGAFVTSTLTTNAPDAANSVWGVSNGAAFEGATADDYETTVSPQDPTADNAVTIPDDAGMLLTSTLTTNGQQIANSIWGVSNGVAFEGATADDFETTVSPTDATADQTLTLPDDSGAVVFSPGGGTTVAGDVLVIPVTHAYVAKTTAGDAEALTLANGENGQILTIDLAVDGGGDGTLTPTTKSGFTSIVFADAGDNATLMYIDDTVGWIIQGTAGVAAPPVIVD